MSRSGLVSVLVTAAVAAGAAPAPGSNVVPKGRVAVLLAEGRLQLIDASTGDRVVDFVASGARRYALEYGRLARAAGADDVFAVLPDETVPVLAAITVRTASARTIGRLPAAQYWALAAGQQTGRVYAFSSTGAAVVVLDPKTAAVVARFTSDNGCTVYGGGVSPDERRVYLAYHGSCSGVDVFDVHGESWRRAFFARSHGNFALLEDTLLATTGEPDVLEINADGETVRSRSSLLVNNHQMELALSRDQKAVYFVGSCGYAGGFSRLDLRPGGTAKVLVPSGDTSVCGERLSVSSDEAWVAVASVRNPFPAGINPRTDRPGRLLIIDAKTGAILRDIATTTDIVDVLVVD